MNGTVIDGLGSEPIRDGIVVIAGDRIEFVGKATAQSDRGQALVIDAQGGTILPGIIDAHVHSAADSAIRREFLTNGVTAVCDLGSPLKVIDRFDEDRVGNDPVARGFHAGPIITVAGGLPDAVLQADLNYEIGNPDEGRAAVVDLHNRGVDVIKVYLHSESNGVVYPVITAEELASIADEAHALGLLVRAHVTSINLLGVAAQAGVDVIEHVPIHDTQADAKSAMVQMVQSNDPLQLFFAELYPAYEDQLEMMAEAGAIMIPTLDRPFGGLYRMPERTAEFEVVLEGVLAIVRKFHEFGGDVGVGTDFNIGTGMHAGMPLGEIEMLLAAGLTPMEVIEASTRISAEACGQGEELGTLEPGKLADLIVVDGDPLEDFHSLSNVILVIKDGEIAVNSKGSPETDR